MFAIFYMLNNVLFQDVNIISEVLFELSLTDSLGNKQNEKLKVTKLDPWNF